jgi:hypothetical protein
LERFVEYHLQRQCYFIYNLGFDLLNKYFSFLSKLDEANAPLPDLELKTNNNITDLNVSIEEISDIIQILHPNKASELDVIKNLILLEKQHLCLAFIQ